MSGCNHFESDLFDFGSAHKEVGVSFKVDNTHAVEVACLDIGDTAVRLTCCVCACANGNADLIGIFYNVGHKGSGAVFNTEVGFVVEFFDMSSVGVVVHRSNGESKVPNCFGVNVVDTDTQNFVTLGYATVCAVGRNAVFNAVYSNGFSSVCKLDTGNVGVCAGCGFEILFHCLVHNVIVKVYGSLPVH